MRNARPAPQQPSDMPLTKYRPPLDVVSINLPDRIWLDERITAAPHWLSTDLCDDNQSLIESMDPQARHAIFDLLMSMGFKEIEIGFPAAFQTDSDFVRFLVDDGAIPEDATISVLTQSCGELIDRTLDACIDIPRVTVHFYNAPSPLFRNVVFRVDRDQIREPAVNGTCQIMARAEKILDEDTVFGYEYSPKIFVDTEFGYSPEVCQAVMDVWQPEEDHEIILNLPATIERATPNVYADQIEWMSRHLLRRESVCPSLHNHNDRDLGVAAAKLGLMTGVNRVEGCLFGHGERTGNANLATLALNLFSQGAGPTSDLSDIDEVRRIIERVTGMDVSPRTPYAGELVYIFFSGSHQDTIKKGFAARNTQVSERKAEGLTDAEAQIAVPWAMPYLSIDPHDVGRFYEAVVYVSSQSSKGGVVYLPGTTRKLELSRRPQIEFFRIAQHHTDTYDGGADGDGPWSIFTDEYLPAAAVPEAGLNRWGCFELYGVTLTSTGDDEDSTLTVTPVDGGAEKHPTASGNGSLDAFVTALESTGLSVKIPDYVEHVLSEGRDTKTASYVECEADGQVLWGVGIDPSITTSPFKAVIPAINRALR